MAKWTKNKVTPEQINNGNEYTTNDNLSVEAINGIVNNSFKAQEDAERALELAEGANKANGTVVEINGEPQGTWDATIAQQISEESSNILNPKNCGTNYNVEQDIFEGAFNNQNNLFAGLNINKKVTISLILYSKPTFATTFATFLANGAENTSGKFTSIQNFEINKVYKITVESLNRMVIWTSGNPTNSFSFRLWINDGETGKPYYKYNSNRHITNGQAEYLKEEYYTGSNELYIPDQNITKNGITVNVKNGVITANGTATANTDIILTNSLNIGAGKYSINFFETLPIVSGVYCNLRYSSGSALGYGSSARAVTTTNTITNMNFYVTSGVTLNNFILKPMLVKGINIPYEYNNYNSSSHITNGHADLLKSEWEKDLNKLWVSSPLTIDINGVTITIDNDKQQITLNGTATDSVWKEISCFNSPLKNGKTYTVSGNIVSGSSTGNVGFYVYTKLGGTPAFHKVFYGTQHTKTHTLTQDTNIDKIAIHCSSGAVFNNFTFNVQMNEGYTELPHQPYNGSIIHTKDIKPVLLWRFGQFNVGQEKQENLTMLSRQGYKYIIIAYQTYAGYQYVKRYAKFEMISSTENVIVINDSHNNSTMSSRRVTIQGDTTFTIHTGYLDGTQNSWCIIIQEIYGSNY